MSHGPLTIDLRSLSSEGKDLAGTLPPAFFGLPAEDTVQATSPLRYQLHVEKDDGDLLIHGELEADFSLLCGRCAETFPHRVQLLDYATELEIGEGLTMDLTECVREDMLLTLPSYPRCEDGNVQSRECPAQGRFQSASDDGASSESPKQDRAVWEVLDQLQKKR
jgi:uncharacterized protein